ncbi:MFP1 attachment factor 1-like [Mercurialis annua]|uniref:MFP1 attachment factor 1-like n=1 Tax=Mercurialis annua TaxID=3986 RepID=UPI00215E28C5|nr:MFP1 attachment factor 1-like [Mercurialis annua]
MTDSDSGSIITQETVPAESQQQEPPKKVATSGISLSIWPPTQRTRDAVITRLIETLASPSILTKRYGTLPLDEAETAARQLEDEAFGVANTATSSDDDGLEILQVYSKEISRRMLDTVKEHARPEYGSNGVSETTTPDAAAHKDVSGEAEA